VIVWNVLNSLDAKGVWPHIAKDVEECLATGPGNDIEQVRLSLIAGRSYLAVARDEDEIKGAAVYQIVTKKNKKIAFVISMTGNGIANNDSINDFYRAIKEQGAERLQALCRPSAGRLWSRFGLKETYKIMEVDLWADL
jgi:hypothetical protein